VPRLVGKTLARWQETALVILLYSLLTVALTWPLATQFTSNVPDGGDSWRYLWNLWWAKTSLLDLHTDFYHTNYLFYPTGVNLYLDTPTPLLGAISIPLQLVGVNLVTIYNLLMALSFVIAGYGTYLLVKYLTGNRPAAFVSGIVFAFSPYHFAHMLGHLNIASIEWIPLYALALLKALDWPQAITPENRAEVAQSDRPGLFSLNSPQLRWAGIAGIWLAITSYTEWTYALFLLIFTVPVIIWQLLVRPRLGWRACLARAGITIGVWLVLVAPVLVPMLQEARTANYGQTSLNDAAYFSSDLTDAFVPSLFHPLWSTLGIQMNDRWQTRPRSEKIVFVGYTVFVVAVATAIVLRRRPGLLFWAWLALAAWILSLGPIVYIWGQHFFFGTRVPMPYSLLYYVPFFNIMRVPSRFTLLVMLALAVLVGYGLAEAGRARFQFRGIQVGRVAWALVGLLVIFEFLPVPYPMQYLNYDEPFYQEIAREPGQLGILDLPLTQLAIYEGYQTIHGKPIVDGYLARQPLDPLVDNTPVLHYLLPSIKVDDPLGVQAAREGVAELQAANIRYVILHEWPFTASTTDEIALRTKIARIFVGVTPRVVTGNQGTLTVFQLSP
jgi:hypothetical protein